MLTMGNWQKWGDVVKFLALRCNNLMKDTCLNYRGKTLCTGWILSVPSSCCLAWGCGKSKQRTCNCSHTRTDKPTLKRMSETSRIQGHYMQSPRRNKLQSETLKIKRSQNTYKPFERRHRRGRSPFRSSLWRQTDRDRRREIAKRI